MSGYIAIQRGLLEHPIFKDEPLTEREAWIWLIEEAAWKPRRVRIDNRPATLDRGELAHSLRYMATAWKWDKNRVWRFLRKLVAEGMIETAQEYFVKNGAAAGHLTQRITICNYDKYQSPRDTAEPKSGTAAGQLRDKEEPLNHLTKEIDRDAGAVHDEVLKIAKVEPDDPFFFGSNYGVQSLLARGFSRETILAGAANAMRGRVKPPPWNYFAKCIESENEQRSSPAKKEIRNGNTGSVIAAADRLVERIREFDSPIRSPEGAAVVGLLPKGGGQRS